MAISTEIDALFADWSGTATPGAVMAVTRHGRTLHEAAYGMADLAHGIPLDRRSVLRIGSQSKQFTVLLALLLEADGKLSLDDEVHRYAPWLPRYPWPITLRQLAGNTSGLRDFLEIMIWSGLPLAAPSTRQTARALLARHDEVNYLPGEQMLYSNTGFFLLSDIIEEVAGRSYNELLRTHVTGPLGMSDTCLQIHDHNILPRLAHQHAKDANGAWHLAHWGFPLGGEGGMVSSLADMLTWQANLATPTPAYAAALERMQAIRHYNNGAETLYLLGLVGARYRGLFHVGHGGGTAGCKSESVRFPEQELGIVILGNAAEIIPYSLALRIADTTLGQEMTPALTADARSQLAASTGLYRHDGGDDIFEILPDGRFRSSGGAVEVTEEAPGVFAPERTTMHLSFRLAPDGIDATWCGTPRHYCRLGQPAPKHDIVGDYTNFALGLDACVTDTDAGLRFRIRSDAGTFHAVLSWIDDDLLLLRESEAGPWLATLLVTEQGLSLTSDRTKRLRLLRS